MIISVQEGGAPLSEQVREQIRGLITTGALAAGQRLPSVRQLALDLGLAPRTVAKAYKALESDGLVTTRSGAGTRVALSASPTHEPVVGAARSYMATCQEHSIDVDEAIRILRALW